MEEEPPEGFDCRLQSFIKKWVSRFFGVDLGWNEDGIGRGKWSVQYPIVFCVHPCPAQGVQFHHFFFGVTSVLTTTYLTTDSFPFDSRQEWWISELPTPALCTLIFRRRMTCLTMVCSAWYVPNTRPLKYSAKTSFFGCGCVEIAREFSQRYCQSFVQVTRWNDGKGVNEGSMIRVTLNIESCGKDWM
jgi:hypothetical protein